MKKKVFVALSGGVDSAVSAALLQRQGYVIHGVFLKCYEDETDNLTVARCPWKEDQEMVERVADHLGIEWETWNFTKEYHDGVLEYFYREYANGRTPNPDVMCNEKIKFGVFFDRAIQSGADYVATGHYARIHMQGTRAELHAASDFGKDQSYFLYRLSGSQLNRTLFPLGEMHKSKVRVLAQSLRLPNADRPDSQGICFIGPVKMADFLRRRIPESEGSVRDTHGVHLGVHRGHAFVTIGQRHGMGISGAESYYVAKKVPASNTIVLARGNSDPALYSTTVYASQTHWIHEPPRWGDHYMAKIRYRQPNQRAVISQVSARALHIQFHEPQWAPTPGQSVVLYDNTRVLGGAIIDECI